MLLNEFKDQVSGSALVLVDYYADWCGPCRQIKPIIDQIEKAYADKLTVIRVNVDESPEIAQQFGVMSIPTVHIAVYGGIVEGFTGYRTKAQIEGILKDYV